MPDKEMTVFEKVNDIFLHSDQYFDLNIIDHGDWVEIRNKPKTKEEINADFYSSNYNWN